MVLIAEKKVGLLRRLGGAIKGKCNDSVKRLSTIYVNRDNSNKIKINLKPTALTAVTFVTVFYCFYYFTFLDVDTSIVAHTDKSIPKETWEDVYYMKAVDFFK